MTGIFYGGQVPDRCHNLCSAVQAKPVPAPEVTLQTPNKPARVPFGAITAQSASKSNIAKALAASPATATLKAVAATPVSNSINAVALSPVSDSIKAVAVSREKLHSLVCSLTPTGNLSVQLS